MNSPILKQQLALNLLQFFDGKPGMARDIPIEAYHADRSCVSTTLLKAMARSPAHFQHALQTPFHDTPALTFGRALHAYVLEPELFEQGYVIAGNTDRRTKSFKNFSATHVNRAVLSQDEGQRIYDMGMSLCRHQTICNILASSEKEVTLIWQDEETGIWVKIRPDCLTTVGDSVCADLKSCEDASNWGFAFDCRRYDYDLQAAIFVEGLKQIFKRDFDFMFIPAEKEPPHGVAIYGASEDMLRRGKRRFREALRLLKKCRDSNVWPSYQPDGDIELLNWGRHWD